MVEIKEVKNSIQLKKFIKFPFKLYKDNPYWVPPLIIDEINTLKANRNPAFDYCEAKYFLAIKNGKIVGRIAGIINKKYIEKWGNKYARFGWVDFIDEQEISSALFKAVEDWAKSKGMTGIHGPLGFCDLDKEGMLVEGFDELSMFITIYNYPYYPMHLEKLGYKKDIDWVEFQLKVPEKIPERLIKLNKLVLKRISLKKLQVGRSKELLPYAKGIFDLLNEAYANLYGVVELTPKQIDYYTKQYFSYIKPEHVNILLDENNKVAAFGIVINSLAHAAKKANGRLFPFGFFHILKAINKSDCLDLLLVAVRPDLQNKGLMSLIITDVCETAMKNGIKFAETGPELETNKNVQGLWKFFEGRQHKRRRCYIKHLN